MNSAEQTVTWLITLGVLESPKKTISDPEAFLQTSLKDGVVLCRLLERLSPGSTEKIYQDPKNDGECLSNIKEFLKGCTSFRVEVSRALRIGFILYFYHTFPHVTTPGVAVLKMHVSTINNGFMGWTELLTPGGGGICKPRTITHRPAERDMLIRLV
ncbi:rho guanine nucleotide exchange factor 7-like [Notothenia coriiceps]|uniref:Rho guanine nucleotide exchange factor 7-like n=1 Tax=Notothenia coriiceps TaxID=8208 RepID=A0A6I9MZC1_9TELE|nr:PREDICTED: rho guanine nucleotide exchange factor 7-like [Notothenia coriiceps]